MCECIVLLGSGDSMSCSATLHSSSQNRPQQGIRAWHKLSSSLPMRVGHTMPAPCSQERQKIISGMAGEASRKKLESSPGRLTRPLLR